MPRLLERSPGVFRKLVCFSTTADALGRLGAFGASPDSAEPFFNLSMGVIASSSQKVALCVSPACYTLYNICIEYYIKYSDVLGRLGAFGASPDSAEPFFNLSMGVIASSSQKVALCVSPACVCLQPPTKTDRGIFYRLYNIL